MTPHRIAIALVMALAAPAAADPIVTYASEGSFAADDAEARTRALDAAFASAVTEAIAELAGKNARAQAAAVDREIVKRARRFVASFAVTREGPRGDRFEVAASVRVDHGKLQAKLVELGVVLRDVAPEPPAVARPRATLLYRVVGAGPTASTFGAAARRDLPGVDALVAALARGGYASVEPTAAGPAPDDEGELPVDDLGARALASDVGADLALVVGVTVGPIGPVRGAPLHAAPARAWLHLVDVKANRTIREAAVATGAWGDRERTPIRAAERAAAQLAAQVFGPASGGDGPRADAPPITASQGVTVRVRGAGAWNAANLVRADLARTPGVGGVAYAGVGADLVVLSVRGLAAEKAAAIAKATPGFAARTRVEDGVVEVRLQ